MRNVKRGVLDHAGRRQDSPLERYLSAATKGLWGRRRREVREELESHLLERAERLRALGLSKEQALERACGQMGRAGRVAWGMVGVHSMSKIGVSTIALLLAVPFGFFGWQAWFYAAYQGQNEGCGSSVSYEGGPTLHFCLSRPSSLDVNAVVRRIEALGFPVERRAGSQAEALRVVTLPPGSPGKVLIWNLSDDPVASRWGGVNVLGLAQEFAQKSTLPVKLEGWERPVLRIGDRSLSLASERSSETAYNVYAARAFDQVAPLFGNTQPPPLRLSRTGNLETAQTGLMKYNFRADAPAGAVVGVLAWSGKTLYLPEFGIRKVLR